MFDQALRGPWTILKFEIKYIENCAFLNDFPLELKLTVIEACH